MSPAVPLSVLSERLEERRSLVSMPNPPPRSTRVNPTTGPVGFVCDDDGLVAGADLAVMLGAWGACR